MSHSNMKPKTGLNSNSGKITCNLWETGPVQLLGIVFDRTQELRALRTTSEMD